MKNAIVVVGPESSGIRLMTRLLIHCGCSGNGTTDQSSISETVGPHTIVIHRSFPYGMKGSGRHWPTISDTDSALRVYGYYPRYVVMVRDEYCATHSAMKAHHIDSIIEAVQDHARAYRDIFTGLASFDLPFVVVPYESLVLHGGLVMGWLAPELGLEVPSGRFTERVSDENAKHYLKIGK